MTPNDDLAEQFLAHLEHLQGQVDEAAEVMEAAEELYAPASLARPPRTLPGLVARRSSLVPTQPHQLVTVPVWVAFNAVLFGTMAVLAVGVELFATALLMAIGAQLDAMIGLPIGWFGAGCLGVMATLGTLAQLGVAFCERVRNCPW